MNKLDMESKDIVNENIEKISELFPNVIVESEKGKAIDFDLLKQELSKEIVEGNKEKYQLTWPGKKEAIINANTPCNKTLRPVKEKSVDFENTQNIYIEGDNLEVLKILQESYLNKIKCIYIDPPYNTGNDFIYNDKFDKNSKEELKESGQIDEYNNRLISNSDTRGKFHSDWLTMMYSRLKLARNLLKPDGVIFVSIDENEQNNLKKICDEIFGEDNFVCNFIWRSSKGSGNDGKLLLFEHEYILMYAKNISNIKFKNEVIEIDEKTYNLEDEYVDKRGKYCLGKLDRGSKGYVKSLDYGIQTPDGNFVFPNGRDHQENDGWRWMWSEEKLKWGIENGFIVIKKGNNGKWNVYSKQYAYVDNEDKPIIRTRLYKSHIGFEEGILNITANSEIKKIFEYSIFSYPKPVELIKKILKMIYIDNEIVLDFFAGSSTTAHAVMELNSSLNMNIKYIMIQLPESCSTNSYAEKMNFKTISDIGIQRITKVGREISKDHNIDYGIRVFKVDSSNMKDVYYKPNEIKQQNLFDYASNIKEGRTPEDLLTQVVLDLGLTLDLKIEEKNILNNKIYFVDSNSLIACFDNEIDINIVEEICKYNPLKVVFKDESFKTDNDKINLQERFKKLLPNTEVNVI